MLASAPTILLVEDDPEIRLALGDLLRTEGMEVIVCVDGNELKSFIDDVMLFDQARPRVDACISDVRMPGMSGIDVLRYARQLNWDLPTLIITAYGDSEVRRRALASGAVELFEKPIDLDRLLQKLHAVLAEQSF